MSQISTSPAASEPGGQTKPDFAAWWAGSNVRSEQLTPFDYGIETIDPFYGATFGLRQTWQTKRGIGDKRRNCVALDG